MAFGLFGRNAVQTRPEPHAAGSDGAPNTLWARNKSAPGANDGYEFTADDLNELLAQLRALLSALNGDVVGSAGNELAVAVLAALDSKVSLERGLAELEDTDAFVRMTVEERAKLAAVHMGYKGEYADLAALQSAFPDAQGGDWAILSNGTQPATVAKWDSDNDPADWVDSNTGPSTIDWAAVTSKPTTFPPAAHGHEVADVSGLSAVLEAKANEAEVVSALTGKEPANANLLKRDETAALDVGYTSPSKAQGTKSSGTFTPSMATGNVQHFTNNGAFTLAPPTGHGSLVLDQINGASAGAVTRSGFTKVTGDALTTTNGHKFRHFITVGDQGSHCHTQALQ